VWKLILPMNLSNEVLALGFKGPFPLENFEASSSGNRPFKFYHSTIDFLSSTIDEIDISRFLMVCYGTNGRNNGEIIRIGHCTIMYSSCCTDMYNESVWKLSIAHFYHLYHNAMQRLCGVTIGSSVLPWFYHKSRHCLENWAG